jgi:hypothetical protein
MTRTDATGANFDGFDTSVPYGLDFLEVRVPGFLCFIVGVAYVIAEVRSFTTDFTNF